MMINPCVATQQWLDDAATSQQAEPPESLVSHIADCPRCRGALAIITADLLSPLSSCEAIGCAECEDQLAAFIDRKHHAGLVAAIRISPAVWWHLLVCRSCSALHDEIEDLLAIAHDV